MAWADDPFLSFMALTAATTIDKVVGFLAPPDGFFFGLAFFATFFFGLFLLFFTGDATLAGEALLLLDLVRGLLGTNFEGELLLLLDLDLVRGLLGLATDFFAADFLGEELLLLDLVRGLLGLGADFFDTFFLGLLLLEGEVLLLLLLLLDLERFFGLRTILF